ncbi:type I methionyl aminopeptidase [Patescibacteria group bacterium]|nr:type I methionyl aminopeptidase [Patescibacteria group bacterium]
MIPLKSAKEIKTMEVGGRKLAWVMGQIKIKPGMSLKEIDRLAEQLIEKQGGKPSFKMVEGYHWASCLNVNQGVVHGVPNDYQLKDGDLLSIDIGMFYQGLHTDMARTIRAKSEESGVRSQDEKFLEAGKRALAKAVQAAKSGSRVGHISQAIEKEIKRYGFQPIQALVGHGVGKKLHEPPAIPCFLKGKIANTEKLKSGMTLAIEIIYTQGKPKVVVNNDGWTIETADEQLAGLFENTVVVTKRGPIVLTKKANYT